MPHNIIYFDTNVFYNVYNKEISRDDLKLLDLLKSESNVTFCYTSINFTEIISHFHQMDEAKFIKYQSIVKVLLTYCDNNLSLPDEALASIFNLSDIFKNNNHNFIEKYDFNYAWKIMHSILQAKSFEQLKTNIDFNESVVKDLRQKDNNFYKETMQSVVEQINPNYYRKKAKNKTPKNTDETILSEMKQTLNSDLYRLSFLNSHFLRIFSQNKLYLVDFITEKDISILNKVAMYYNAFRCLFYKNILEGRTLEDPNDLNDIRLLIFLGLSKNHYFITYDERLIKLFNSNYKNINIIDPIVDISEQITRIGNIRQIFTKINN